MSKGIVEAERERELYNAKQEALQKKFLVLGGDGNVIDFLEWGATSPQMNPDRNWDSMTSEQQGMWLELLSDNVDFETGFGAKFKIKMQEMAERDQLVQVARFLLSLKY